MLIQILTMTIEFLFKIMKIIKVILSNRLFEYDTLSSRITFF